MTRISIGRNSSLGDHLAVGLVYDLPESMVMLHRDQLKTWDVTFFEAFEIARANLADLEASFGSMEDRLYISDTNDNFDASRVIMTEWIRQLQVKGAPVATVPNRDKLIVTGSEDAKGLRMMARLTCGSVGKTSPH